ncbi:MAG: cupin domain-containing protein [Candidatus Rokubacteria bacterium]|nr:cupin domain-containing protein [Candidatus Rokubacteria bacterium]
MLTLKIDDFIEFHSKAFVRKRLVQTDSLNFNMYCIEPGQKNPLHRHPITEEVLFFLEGEGDCIVGKEVTRVTPRTAVWVPKDTPHEIINTGTARMIVVLVQAPTPCEHVYVGPEEVGEPLRV